MSYILLICQLVLAFFLLLAALTKTIQPGQFLAALKASGLPESHIWVITVVVLIAEQSLAYGLLFGYSWSLPLVLLTIFGLLGLFTAWLAWVRQRNLNISCGCFGISQQPVGLREIVRNGVLLAVTSLAFVLSLATMPVFLFQPDPVSVGIPGALILACLVSFYIRAHQPGRLSQRLSRLSLEPPATAAAKPKELLLKRLPREASTALVATGLNSPAYYHFKQKLLAEFGAKLDLQEDNSYVLDYARRKRSGMVVHWRTGNGKNLTGYGFIVIWFRAGSQRVLEITTGRFTSQASQSTRLLVERNGRSTLQALFTPAGQILQGQISKLWKKPVKLDGQNLRDLAKMVDMPLRLLMFG